MHEAGLHVNIQDRQSSQQALSFWSLSTSIFIVGIVRGHHLLHRVEIPHRIFRPLRAEAIPNMKIRRLLT